MYDEVSDLLGWDTDDPDDDRNNCRSMYYERLTDEDKMKRLKLRIKYIAGKVDDIVDQLAKMNATLVMMNTTKEKEEEVHQKMPDRKEEREDEIDKLVHSSCKLLEDEITNIMSDPDYLPSGDDVAFAIVCVMDTLRDWFMDFDSKQSTDDLNYDPGDVGDSMLGTVATMTHKLRLFMEMKKKFHGDVDGDWEQCQKAMQLELSAINERGFVRRRFERDLTSGWVMSKFEH